MKNNSVPNDEIDTQKNIKEALQASLIIHSSDLFGCDGNLVMIQHGNHWYRLMLTKQGKLILTK